MGGYSVDDPALVRAVTGEAFHHPGPALVEASVDPNEPQPPALEKLPPIRPGNSPKALAKGQKDRWDIIKTDRGEQNQGGCADASMRRGPNMVETHHWRVPERESKRESKADTTGSDEERLLWHTAFLKQSSSRMETCFFWLLQRAKSADDSGPWFYSVLSRLPISKRL